MPTTDYFMREFGTRLFRNGYDPIPIKIGDKAPAIENWRDMVIDEVQIERWKLNGRARNGVGLRTATMPTIDSDCHDAGFQKEFLDRLKADGIPLGLMKIGRPPKIALVYRADETFTKLTGPAYTDDRGLKAQLEILGDGQQTVCFAIHPEINRPYRWINWVSPLNVKWSALELMTLELAERVMEIWTALAEERGWELRRRASTQLAPRNTDPEWIGDDGTEPVQDLSDDEVADIVRAIPNDDRFAEREDWINFGMAISHQLDHSELAQELFVEWSEQQQQRPGEVEKVWKSIKDDVTTRQPITFRHLLKIYKEQTGEVAQENAEDFIDRLDKCRDDKGINTVCAEATRVDMPPMLKTRVVDALQKAYLRLHQVKLPVADARRMVTFKRQRSDGMPKWAEDWCYIAEMDRFLNTKSNQFLKGEAFDRMFGEHVFKGDLAHKYALDQLGIPKYDLALYLPTADLKFRYNGKNCINTYSEKNVPTTLDSLTRDDQRAIENVEAHLNMLVADKRDRAMLTSYLAYITQTRDRINWAMVLIGLEGDGKTFLFEMMAQILGGDNCKTITASTVINSTFTDWASGSLLACVEEVRMQGHNRYDALNKIKPLITNAQIEIHPKGLPVFNGPNTQSYMLTSNFDDALPLTVGDTRYYVIQTRYRSETEFDKWKASNRRHFHDLHDAITNHGAALRQWLLDYRLHEEFEPKLRAPHSQGKADMIDKSKSDEAPYLQDLLNLDNVPGVSETVLLSGELSAAMSDKFDLELTPGHSASALLKGEGFIYLGRVKLSGGNYQGLWSKTPNDLPSGYSKLKIWVQSYINSRKSYEL